MGKATIFDYARMCRKYAILDCCNCPLSNRNNGLGEACDDFMRAFTDKTNEIILNWVKEHPVKTRQDEFLKMFPNAQISSDGVIEITPCAIEKNKHITSNCSCPVAHGFNNCDECRKGYWLEEVKENE